MPPADGTATTRTVPTTWMRIAGGISMAIGTVVALVALAAMSVSGLPLPPLSGLVMVVGGAAVAVGGWLTWRGSTAALHALVVLFAALLVAQGVASDDLDVVNTNAQVPLVTPRVLLAIALVSHVVAAVVQRRADTASGSDASVER